MKQFLTYVSIAIALLLVAGCSDSPMKPSVDHSIVLVERPQYIETRPPEVVANFILGKDQAPYVSLDKKPVPPDPPGDLEDPNPNPPHKYAYIVGISDYEGTANDLNYCDDDAQAMKSWLQGEGFTCRMDLDLNADAQSIIDGLQWLIDNAGPGDEVCFSYSGHGMKSSEGSAIISADLYYITHGYVNSYFNAVDCTKKLMLMDACVIGGFHDECETGSFYATASNRKNSYDAPDLQQGAWTYYWIDGVENQGLVFAEEAAPYAEDGMKAWAAQYRLRVDPKHTDKYDGGMDM
jgi:uncharacterized caspase-like protein